METQMDQRESAMRRARRRVAEKKEALKQINDQIDAATDAYLDASFQYVEQRIARLKTAKTRRTLIVALVLVVVGLILVLAPLPIYIPIAYLVVACVILVQVARGGTEEMTALRANNALAELRRTYAQGGKN